MGSSDSCAAKSKPTVETRLVVRRSAALGGGAATDPLSVFAVIMRV